MARPAAKIDRRTKAYKESIAKGKGLLPSASKEKVNGSDAIALATHLATVGVHLIDCSNRVTKLEVNWANMKEVITESLEQNKKVVSLIESKLTEYRNLVKTNINSNSSCCEKSAESNGPQPTEVTNV